MIILKIYLLILLKKIIADVTEIMMKAASDDNIQKMKWCKEYINNMRLINTKKLEEATSYLFIVYIFMAMILIFKIE